MHDTGLFEAIKLTSETLIALVNTIWSTIETMKSTPVMSRKLAQKTATPLDESTNAEKGGRTGTLVRGLAILEVLLGAPQPMGLVEVVAATGLDQSTAHRLLKTLEDERMVVRNDTTRRYSPSPKFLHPLPLLHPLDQLRRECSPVIGEIAHALRKTTVLVLFLDWERLVLDIAQVPGSLTPYYGAWLHGPLHATGGGKALLMSVDANRRRALLGDGKLEACTPLTIVDVEALDADLSVSAERGYVVSRGEHRVGITNVAVNIKNWSGDTVGCLIVTGHSKEFNEETVAKVGAELKRMAELLLFQAPSLEAAGRFCGR
jgi:DNA-binding IclR family transcriptional regulator